MLKTRARLSAAILLAVLPLLLTACFRDTSETIVQQPVAQEQASATPAVIEAPAATDAPTVDAGAVDEFAMSATALIAQLTEEAAPPTAPAIATEASAPAIAPVARSTIPPGEDCVHEIRVGDTLFALSLAYGVSLDSITLASGIANPDFVSIGQKITIPLCGTTGFIPPPTSIPTAEPEQPPPPTSAPEDQAIAAAEEPRNELVEQAQAALLGNAEADASFSAQAAAPQASGRSYVVQQNDTLLLIAIQQGTSVEVLAALNNITDVDSLDAGQILQLP